MPTLTNLVVNLTGNANKLQRTVNTAAAGIRSTFSKIALLAGGAFGISALRNFTEAAARAEGQIQNVQTRLDVLGGENISINDIAESANRLGLTFNDVSKGVTRFLIAGKNIGLTNEEVLQLNENIAALGRLAGGEVSETSAGILQLGQALASGALQGDELRSILENLPLVAQEIAKGFGVGVGELRAMGKGGALTSERIAEILLNVEDLDKALAKLPETVDTVNNKLSTSRTRLLASLGVSGGWVAITSRIAESFDNIRVRIAGTDEPIETLNNKLTNARDKLSRAIAGTPIADQLNKEIAEIERQITRLEERRKQAAEKDKEVVEKGFISGIPEIQKTQDLISRLTTGKAGVGVTSGFKDLVGRDKEVFADFLNRATAGQPLKEQIARKKEELTELKRSNGTLGLILNEIKSGGFAKATEGSFFSP